MYKDIRKIIFIYIVINEIQIHVFKVNLGL
ncbi:hypothetical protein BH10BAC2_BH10BAC2_32220 [soil metagenome]